MSAVENRFVLATVVAIAYAAPSVRAAEPMPNAAQNAIVQKHCAVCHTDSLRRGGLSLEHFDAATAPPDLFAMLLSKLTSGVRLQIVRDSHSDATAAVLVDHKVQTGAMGASGLPRPPKDSMDSLLRAFALASSGAMEWTATRGAQTIASIVQEASVAAGAKQAESYRLLAVCDTTARTGYLQLVWSPVAHSGRFSASVDGNAAVEYLATGTEPSEDVLDRPASALLKGLPLPGQTLTITGLATGETVTFPFSALPGDARRDLKACFPAPRH